MAISVVIVMQSTSKLNVIAIENEQIEKWKQKSIAHHTDTDDSLVRMNVIKKDREEMGSLTRTQRRWEGVVSNDDKKVYII